MPATLVCETCKHVLYKSTESVELERDSIRKCPKCKRELPYDRAGDRVFVEGREIGLIV